MTDIELVIFLLTVFGVVSITLYFLAKGMNLDILKSYVKGEKEE